MSTTADPMAYPQPYVPDDDKKPTSPKEKEKLPYWFIILVATILAIFMIWLLMILMYPSMALA